MACITLLAEALSIIVLLKLAYTFCVFIYPYLHTSSVQQFHHGADTYALVTGASDGIGKAIAKELYARGFNLILHGRNEEKLWKTAEDIRRARGPLKDVKLWIADATSPSIDFEAVAEKWKRLNITLVIHNVSPFAPRPET